MELLVNSIVVVCLYTIHTKGLLKSCVGSIIGYKLINPRRACAARVTVVGLCVCLSVCLFVCRRLFSHYRLRGGL